MEYYLGREKEQNFAICRNIDGLVRCEGLTDLREISLTEKDKYCMISLTLTVYDITFFWILEKKKKDSKLVNRTENNRE